MKDIWYALDYQDRRINKLIEENQEYKDRLKYTEKRVDVEIKDIKNQISGLQSSMESVIDIVKVSKFWLTLGLSSPIWAAQAGNYEKEYKSWLAKVLHWHVHEV